MQCHFESAEYLSQSLKQWVKKRVYDQRVDLPQTLELYGAAFGAGDHRPDVAEGQAGEQDAPQQGQGHAEERGEEAVAPVLRYREGGVTGFPYTVQTVSAMGLRNHVLKLHLDYIPVDLGGVSVDEVYLFGATVPPELLLLIVVQLNIHVLHISR